MANCTYCGKEITFGTGKIYVKDNGQVLNFCSGKCEKNMLKLGRDARKFKWTKFFEKGEAPATAKTPKKKAVKKTATKVNSK